MDGRTRLPLDRAVGSAPRGFALAGTLVCAVAFVFAPPVNAQQPAPDWAHAGGDPGGSRFSPATQITPANVVDLAMAWTYRTGDLIEGRTRFQATPLLIGRTLYLSTPFGRVIALDAATGRERWTFDPRIDVRVGYGDFANRGVAYWAGTGGSAAAPAAPCAHRIFVAPIDARLIALDAPTGQPCADFGARGTVDLSRDLLSEPRRGEYQVTSPPLVVNDVVVVGSAIADNQRLDAPSGKVRGYDARTGVLRWAWDPVPRDAHAAVGRGWEGARALQTGAANVWAVMSADPERDLLFVPTGSPSPDFYGGERLGDNRWANSVVALRAATGEPVWSFQTVHHDVWDYDLPAQPILTTVRRAGQEVPVVVQLTKTGLVFVLHRETGEPVFGVEEMPVPASDVPGERVSPTQPRPVRPAPLVPDRLSAAAVWGPTPADQAWCREAIAGLRSEGIFTPPSLAGSIVFPGNLGGSNWSGGAVDRARRILVTPVNRLATVVRLIPRAELERVGPELRAAGWEVSPQTGTPYAMARRFPFSPSGMPCTPPPWGVLVALDLDTGERRWEVPLGAMAPTAAGAPASASAGATTVGESAEPPAEASAGATVGQGQEAEARGSIGLGGPIVTATGLVFIAGTLDSHLRALDVETGRVLWTGRLPAGGHATPMTYEVDGRQFVVIAAGGHGRLPSAPGDHLVAFALPEPGAAGAAAVAPAPPPPPAPLDLTGRWQGTLRVAGGTYDVTMTLERDGTAGARGVVHVRQLGLDVALHGTLADAAFRYTGTFGPPRPGDCAGEIAGTLEAEDSPDRLAGSVRVTGACRTPEGGRMTVERSP